MIEEIYIKKGPENDNTALIYQDKSISYGEMHANIRKTAAMFWEKGIRYGSTVAVVLPNCPEFIYTVFGAWEIGAIIIPLDFRLKKDEYSIIFEQTEPQIVVTAENAAGIKAADMVNGATETVAAGEKILILTKEKDFPPAEAGAYERYEGDFDAMIQYTSGTMGKPKGILKKASAFLLEAKSVADRLGYTGEDRILTVSPLYHAYAFGDALVSGLYAGAALLLEERFTGREQLDTIQKHKATAFPGVPFMFGLINQLNGVKSYDISSLRVCTSAGAALPEETAVQFRNNFGIYIYSLYGSSESNTICVNTMLASNGLYKSVGTAVDGVEIFIKDEEGRELPRGTQGDIWVRSAIAGYQYYKQPELTASVFRDGCIITGDVGYMDGDGLLFITGRKKSFINVGGEKVDPSEIELVIRKHPGVKDCVVVGVMDDMGGEVIKAVVVPWEIDSISRTDITNLCGKHLAAFKVPRIVKFMEALPVSPTGKILRKLLI